MTAGRLWWLLRRDWNRGWRASFHHYFSSRKIVRWRNPYATRPPEPVPVMTLTRGEDWLLGLWMLASWFVATGRNWQIIALEDGTLPPESDAIFGRMFPGCRVIRARESDGRMAKVLAEYPECARYRREHPLARKIFDMPTLAGAERFLAIDSDVLFFSRPDRLLELIDADDHGCWFNEDVAEGSLVSEDEAARELGVSLWPKVNSGLGIARAEAFAPGFCEEIFARTRIREGHFWRIEQTLFALCASRWKIGGLLPPEYEVSLGRRARPDAVCRHYVGAVRDRFFGEGIPRVLPALGHRGIL